MALQLVESMSTGWKPEEYTDDYREALKDLIEEKIEARRQGHSSANQEEAGRQWSIWWRYCKKHPRKLDTRERRGTTTKSAKSKALAEAQEGGLVHAFVDREPLPVGERPCEVGSDSL